MHNAHGLLVLILITRSGKAVHSVASGNHFQMIVLFYFKKNVNFTSQIKNRSL